MGIKDKLKGLTESNQKEVKENNNVLYGEYDVFISYSTKNTDTANKACYALEQNGLRCWIAPRNIISASDFESQIPEAIKNSKIVVLIFSGYVQESRFVNNEIKTAFIENKPIIQFCIDEAFPEDDLYYYLNGQSAISAYPQPEKHLETLVKDAFKLLNLDDESKEDNNPLAAYEGDDKYIFVSYIHKDRELVFPDIRQFQNLGYNVYYDSETCETKNSRIAHLKNCEIFIVFVTNESIASELIQKEIKYAVKHKKKIIPIYLEDFDEIEMEDDIDFELSVLQGIIKTTLDNEEYVFKFTEAFGNFGIDIPE